MKRIWKRKLSLVLVASMLASSVFTDTVPGCKLVRTAEAASTGIHVMTHSKEEIRTYITSHPINVSQYNNPVVYEEEPLTTAPYSVGKLSASTTQSALNTINVIRYIAGLDDQVTINADYEKMVQAAALVNYVNNTLSHNPTQPSDMPDDLYELGFQGASSSNIAWASWKSVSLDWTLIHSWMADDDSSNISRVGHRRWILNPTMKQTGFGSVKGTNGNYSAMYSFDCSGTSSDYGVCWPAQNMPVEFFDDAYPWSISMGTTVSESDAKVTVTRQSDQKTWTFSAAKSDGDFYVNNGGYGQKGCIIFRPDNITYSDGDVFHVEVDGLGKMVSYDVEFFSLIETVPTVAPTKAPTVAPTKAPNPTEKPEITRSPSPTQKPVVTSAPLPAKQPEVPGKESLVQPLQDVTLNKVSKKVSTNIKIAIRKGKKYITIRVPKKTKVVLSLNKKWLLNGKKRCKKITLSPSKTRSGIVTVKTSSKLRIGVRVVVSLMINGKEYKATKKL